MVYYESVFETTDQYVPMYINVTTDATDEIVNEVPPGVWIPFDDAPDVAISLILVGLAEPELRRYRISPSCNTQFVAGLITSRLPPLVPEFTTAV